MLNPGGAGRMQRFRILSPEPSSSAFSQGEKGPARLRGGTLTLTLSQRARGSEHLGLKFQICGLFGSIWPRLLLAARLEMRPPWTRLAHRWHTAHSYHCASIRPRWPRLASSGVGRSGETFNSVAFGCISSHFPNPHPGPLPVNYLPVVTRCLNQGFHPHPILLPSREKGSEHLGGNDEALGGMRYADNVAISGAMA